MRHKTSPLLIAQQIVGMGSPSRVYGTMTTAHRRRATVLLCSHMAAAVCGRHVGMGERLTVARALSLLLAAMDPEVCP